MFLTVLLLLASSSIASSPPRRILSPQQIKNTRADGVGHTIDHGEQEQRKLAVYALYNLDPFTVRFSTRKTAELDDARSAAALAAASKDTAEEDTIGDSWTLVSETGGLESSLSYPMRILTQDFLYLGFQNLIDDWLLELSGGPDYGNNDLTYRNKTATETTTNNENNNNDGDFNNRLLQATFTKLAPEVFNIDGGDSTGEQDYNANSSLDKGISISNVTGTEIKVAEETTASVETPPADVQSSGTQEGQQQQQPESPQQSESTPEETTPTDVQSPTQEGQEQQQTESSQQIEPEQTQSPIQYLDIYDGLVYHTIYDHLVTVDLRVKLYLRKEGYYSNEDDEDSLRGRKNLRMLQLDNTGEAELLAEMIPTIAFLEPVSEAKRLAKPGNADVKELFGVWMDYMFGKQVDVYLRTLREYENQDLLQEISKLSVDVDVGSPVSPSASESNSSSSSNNSYTGLWSEKTQNILIIIVVVLAVLAVIWPMYTYAQHVKKDRELRLQLMHGGLSLDGGGGDEYDFSDSFGSVTYHDNVHDMVKLPPIIPSVAAPNSALQMPEALAMSQRAQSLDTARHGKDIFPSVSRSRSDSTKSALHALEASDRYLSRHRPDLFYDKQASEDKGTFNMFGRVYEIPSNPFEFIYKGGEQQQSPQHQSPENHIPRTNSSKDLGPSAHFPFISPRGSFTGRPSSLGSNMYNGRSTSVGSTGNNSIGNTSHFTPIVVPNQNLAAGFSNEDAEEREEAHSRMMAAPGIAAHTGHSWQNNNDESFSSSQHAHPSYSADGNGGSVIGNIFRNLSIGSWYNNDISLNNSYTANPHLGPDYNHSASSGAEEVYYDDDDYPHNDSSLFQREIELESLPNDEEDPENYDFAFQDFPRKDGTPCLIIDDDSFLSERKRRESAKMIFTIDDDEAGEGNNNDGSFSEKKLGDLPVSDEAFKMMLSQNALDIDNSVLQIDDSEDDIMVLPPLEGSFLSEDTHDAKSPEFQSKLSRLVDTKRQRYTRENKNAAIVAANRKKRKNVRERERVDRHKAIERELEDIEAEFSLTMQPLSPDQNKNANTNTNISNNHARTTPKRNTHSPKPSTGGARYSPMPSRMAASPVRKNLATLSPPRSNLSNIAAVSPARSNMPRSRGHGRQNSMGGGHRKQNSLGASPFRTFSPRTRYPGHVQSQSFGGNGDIFRGEGVSRSASHRSVSPPDSMSDLDRDYKPKFRPTNMYGSDRFSGPHGGGGGEKYDDLSLPSMAIGGGKDPQLYDPKFRSPQAVIDEVLQSGAQTSMQNQRHYAQPTRYSHHQRSLTPSRMRPGPQTNSRRRTNSFDVNDDSYQRRIQQSGSTGYSTSSSSQLPQHSMIRQSPSGGHRRVQSGGMGSNHKRANSRGDDIFLHGVVAQTRFV